MIMVSDLIIDNTFNESLKSGVTFITFGSESSKYIPSVLTIDEWFDAEVVHRVNTESLREFATIGKTGDVVKEWEGWVV